MTKRLKDDGVQSN